MEKTRAYSREGRTAIVHSPFMSWQSVIAGIFICMLTFLILISLGVGVGGIALSDLEGMTAFGWGAAIWTTLSAMISLFVGSFVASRVSNYFSKSVGMAQGATIAALFFAIALWGGGTFMGFIGKAVGNISQTAMNLPAINVEQIASQIYQNPQFRSVINQEIRDMGVEPARVDEVIAGVTSRLIIGDTEGARAYLVQNTNLDPNTVSARLDQWQASVQQYAEEAVSATAEAFSAAGWAMFILLVLGSISAIGGGLAGSKANVKHSLEEDEVLRVA